MRKMVYSILKFSKVLTDNEIFQNYTFSGLPGSFHATLNVYFKSSASPILAPLFADM